MFKMSLTFTFFSETEAERASGTALGSARFAGSTGGGDGRVPSGARRQVELVGVGSIGERGAAQCDRSVRVVH